MATEKDIQSIYTKAVSYVKSGFKLRAKDNPQVFSGSNSFGSSLGCAYANLVTFFTTWTSTSGGFRPQATVHLSI